MKKFMFLFVACIAIASILQAQIRPVPKTDKLPIRIQPKEYKLVSSRTTGNYDSKIVVKTWLEDVDGKGKTLKFTSNGLIKKVIIKSPNTLDNITEYTNAGASSGYFFIESPVYANKDSYLIYFYELRHPDKPIWVSLIEHK